MNTFYLNDENCKSYIKMAEAYDNSFFTSLIMSHCPIGSDLLEIGLGSGKDYERLSQVYTILGTDFSTVFIDFFKEKHPEADVMVLDGISLPIERSFGGIYSNKVMCHFSKADIAESFERQLVLLEAGGVCIHTFWKGQGEETFEGLTFYYYEIEVLKELIPDGFDILGCESYKEEADGDSIYLIIKKKG